MVSTSVRGNEFIRMFLMHVLPKGFVRIRHYGLLSCRNKKEKMTLCRNLLGCERYIPSDMVPKCPVYGGRMNMNLRCDQYFVEDEAWYQAENRFSDFLQSMTEAAKDGRNVVLLELGVGFNTPTIIRFPFEKLMREYDNINMIRLNLNEAVVPLSFGNRIVGINEDMDKSIQAIVKKLN